MTRIPLVYMAAPVGAPSQPEIRMNIERGALWQAFLLVHEPDMAITAPWIGPLALGIQRDHVPADRERGLRDNVLIARRCDGIVLCGGRVSRGMAAELEAVLSCGGWVSDLTSLGADPPPPGEFAMRTVIALGRARWEAR